MTDLLAQIVKTLVTNELKKAESKEAAKQLKEQAKLDRLREAAANTAPAPAAGGNASGAAAAAGTGAGTEQLQGDEHGNDDSKKELSCSEMSSKESADKS